MTSTSLPLSGKRALVTGGARGIGAAIVRRLAADGADVALTYEKSAEAAEALAAEVRASGRRAAAIRADAGSPAGATDAIDGAVAALGGVDILVNNAGIARMGDFADLPPEDLEALLNVNVRGVMLTTQAALRHLPDGGRIISIGSNVGERVPFPGITVYAATKSALESFTRGLARELGPRGITVNLVRPGPTDTDMNPADGPFAPLVTPSLAIPRYGRPEEVAAAVAFLAGPEAGYVTGGGILVDGGYNA
ncbi:MAG: SDR family oxidoreductase [Brevundimonas sp.]|uniref:SDR family oxidoreductase n=1 Tax=Brevundimonas sp. TaxID=1871086 RepID=UPI001828F8C0|nr:SDR family oxidoreductase [Brevundimonas sp.]MBA4804762.1 SDR family oxidoreductase [Brevundimonas sp.]